MRCEVNAGVLLGVWGNDAEKPFEIKENLLAGGKWFASGPSTGGQDFVTVGQGVVVPAGAFGCVGTRSPFARKLVQNRHAGHGTGRFDAAQIPATASIIYEPGFIGGVWRIAAVQVGGSLGLLRSAVMQGLAV